MQFADPPQNLNIFEANVTGMTSLSPYFLGSGYVGARKQGIQKYIFATWGQLQQLRLEKSAVVQHELQEDILFHII